MPRSIKSYENITVNNIDFGKLIVDNEPVVFRAAAKDWPIVTHKDASLQEITNYLDGFAANKPLVQFSTEAENLGRFFYNDTMNGFNFLSERVQFSDFLEKIAEHAGNETAPTFYIGSTDVGTYFPDFINENGLPRENPYFQNYRPYVSLWMGNRTTAATHYDFSNNLACNLHGRRRFTLFPPDQIENLYPGPLDPTPAGQVVSMVNLRDIDLEKYPNFHYALESSYETILEAGDVLFYPAMWWHQVEGLDDFNVMMNYWWNTTPPVMDSPMTTLMHAMISLRHRPNAEKNAWKALFDYYIFGDLEQARDHLPPHIQGPLGQLNDAGMRELRAKIMSRLNR